MTGEDLDKEVTALEREIRLAFKGQTTWKDVWSLIRSVSAGFKGARFASREAHQFAWTRFQALVGEVKAQQQEASRDWENRVSKSSEHLARIYGFAEDAEFDDQLLEQLLGLVSVGLYDVMKAGLNALTGPVDEAHEALKARSEKLRRAWAYLSDHKLQMTGSDKSNAHARLERARAKLDQHWEAWKAGKQRAYDGRQAQRVARNAEFEAKQARWRAGQRAFIERQAEGLARLEAARRHREEHLDQLRDKLSEAYSDSYRDRITSWIEEERQRIRDIDEKIYSARAKLNDAQSRL